MERGFCRMGTIQNKRTRCKIWFNIILVAVAVALTTFFFLSQFAEERYWEDSHLDDLFIDMSKYEISLEDARAGHDTLVSAVCSSYESAVPISTECASFFDDCNDMILKFFQDTYSIDVTDKLEQMRVMRVEYLPESVDTVGGSYSSETGILYINAVLLDNFMDEVSAGHEPSVSDSKTFSFMMLRNVYIHETIHSLGFSNEPQFVRFIEAITEALTEKVTEHNGIEYVDVTGYGVIKDLAYQMLDADSEMIQCVLHDSSYKIEAHFNKVMGADWAKTFNDLLFMLQAGDIQKYREIPYLSQYIAYEYIKLANYTTEYSKMKEKSIVHNFELKWLLGLYK